MQVQEHSTVREGLVTGLLGGVIVAVWYLVFDAAARNLALRWGLWIGLVVAFSLFAGLTYMLTTSTAERVSAWSVVGGALAGVAGMGWYLLRNHPRIRADAQASGEAPPHAPGGPRVG